MPRSHLGEQAVTGPGGWSTLIKNSSPKTHSSRKVAAPLHPHNFTVVSKQTNVFYPQKPFLILHECRLSLYQILSEI